MEQINYQSYEPDVGFKPRSVVDYISSLDRQNAKFEKDEKTRADALNLSDANQRLSAKIKDNEIQQLSAFSETLSKKLFKIQKKKGDDELLAGMTDTYMNGSDQISVTEGEQELQAADGVIKETANAVENQGGSTFAAQEIRETSGWYRYGQAIAMVRQGAQTYGAYFDQAAENTVVNVNGRDVTLQTGDLTPAEYSAVMATIRQGFLQQFAGVNPAILDKYLFEDMRKYEDKRYASWATERTAAIKDENINQAVNNFSNGLTDINGGYEELIAAGVSPTAARKLLLDQAYLDFKGGHITEDQLNAILDTPYGPGGTWRSGNRKLLADIEDRIRQENIDDSSAEQTVINQSARDQVNAVRAEMPNADYTDEQLQEQIDTVVANHPNADTRIFKPLYDYLNNHSMQARDREEQEEILDALYASGELSVAELRSGKYSTEVVGQYLGKAEHSDSLRAQAGQQAAASKNQQRSVQDAILRAANLGDIESVRDPSVSLALDAAQAELERMATELKIATPEMSWAAAYNQAAMALTAEIKAGETEQSSRWYVDRLTDPGTNIMPAFTADNSGAVSDVNTANQIVIRARDLALEHGVEALNPDYNVFTREEVLNLSNPNNPPSIKLETVVNAINTIEGGPRLTVSEARQQLADNFDIKLERPFERDPYEDAALTPGMEDALSMRSAAQVARVSEQGDLPNLHVRDGQQGARDVIQVSLKVGAPPHLVPLAAAVFANETGWGRYTTGQNNLFNIKDTTGGGTEAVRNEGDINGPSGGTPQRSNFRDYGTRAESVKDFWEFLESNPRYADVLTAATPMEALRALHAAGYATSPSYVKDVAATWRDMGIDPNQPYESTQLTDSPWGDTRTMSPTAAVYITGNIGPTSTGPHLDVKRVDRQFFNYGDLDGYVYVDDPDMGLIPLGDLPQTGDWESHIERGSHGRDYGTFSGTEIYLKNGAKVVSTQRTAHGDYLVIELPNGVQYSFLHGTAS